MNIVKVPRNIPIGACEFTIVNDTSLMTDHSIYGQCISTRELIKVDSSSTPNIKDVTLIHELFHAVSDIYEVELGEKEIARLAHGWTAILKNSFGIEFNWSDVEGLDDR